MTTDERYMLRALELARLGIGRVAPNPMVGAVIVADGYIIGEGYHHAWGEPHAEVMAVRAVRHPELLKRSTIYVTLEPCAHFGKTPPCADLIVQSGIPRAVVSMLDPYPEVSGRGVQRLRSAGVSVELDVLETEARRLNMPFILQHTEHRPWISLKWAESADGYMDLERESSETLPVVFSSAYRQRIVHRERMEHQAILVGYKTALLDNPSLTNRFWGDKQPIRIVLDPRLALPAHLKLLSDGVAPTWVLYDPELASPPKTHAEHVHYLPLLSSGKVYVELLKRIHNHGIQSLFVEGGAQVLSSFLADGLYDCIEIERSAKRLGSGIRSPQIFF